LETGPDLVSSALMDSEDCGGEGEDRHQHPEFRGPGQNLPPKIR